MEKSTNLECIRRKIHIKHRPKVLALAYPLIFLVATSMFVRSWVPIFFSSWPVLLSGCLLSIIVVPQFLRTKWFLSIVIYSLVVLLNWFYGDAFFKDFSLVANEIACYFLFSSAVYYLFVYDDKRCFNWIYYIIFIMLGCATIGSVMVNRIIPGIIRLQNEYIGNDNSMELIIYYRMGLSNYLLPHALPPIIPPLVFFIKRSNGLGLKRLVAIVFLFFTITLIYLGGATTALLLGFIGLVTFFIREDGDNQYKIPLIISMCMLPFLLFPEIIPLIIGLFSSETAETYAMHFEDLARASTEESSQGTSTRIALYMQSFGGFLDNIVLGSSAPMSEHSVLLDRMGTLGLIGFIPLITIFSCFFHFVRKYFGKAERVYFNVSFFLCFVMLLTKGIDDKEIWLMIFVVSPVILYKASQLSPVKTRKNETYIH